MNALNKKLHTHKQFSGNALLIEEISGLGSKEISIVQKRSGLKIILSFFKLSTGLRDLIQKQSL